jgi:hypothetical protein
MDLQYSYSAAFCNYLGDLWQSATICNHMQLSVKICNHLQPYATICNYLQPSATICNYLQQSATANNFAYLFEKIPVLMNMSYHKTKLYRPTTNLQLFVITCIYMQLLAIFSAALWNYGHPPAATILTLTCNFVQQPLFAIIQSSTWK